MAFLPGPPSSAGQEPSTGSYSLPAAPETLKLTEATTAEWIGKRNASAQADKWAQAEWVH